MYIFKTSSETYDSVIRNEAHAFRGMPTDWSPGELILVSKNRRGLGAGEKQISHVMKFKDVRPLRSGEAERLWPGNEGRWKYIVECAGTQLVQSPFDLEDLLGDQAKRYKPIVSFGKIKPEHERLISDKLAPYSPQAADLDSRSTISQKTDSGFSQSTSIKENREGCIWVILFLVIAAFFLGVWII